VVPLQFAAGSRDLSLVPVSFSSAGGETKGERTGERDTRYVVPRDTMATWGFDEKAISRMKM